jgi:outer membrane protein assembly factor BamB
MRTRALKSFVVLALLRVFSAQADDWPQWRGPNRDGVWNEKGLRETFPTNGLNVRWRSPVGFGYSSPVITQGRVYVTDSQLKKPKARDRVLCFTETAGKLLWTFTNEVSFPEWAFTPNNEQGPNSTPVVRDGRLYAVGSLAHYLYCLDATNGALLWQKDVENEYQLPESSNSSASPLIDGERLILLIGGKPTRCVAAFDRNTGKEVWSAVGESAAHSSPIIVEAGRARQLIVWTRQSVTSLNPVTGKLHWREPFPGADTGAVSTPVTAGDLLLVGGLMLKLDSNKPAATILWPESRVANRRILSGTSTALLQRDLVFSARSSGEFVCFEAATGRQLWGTNRVTDLSGGASVHLTANGGSVLLFNDRGELIRARLTAQGYHEISRASLIKPAYPFGGRNVAWTPPSYANGHVFARTEKELVCASLEP